MHKRPSVIASAVIAAAVALAGCPPRTGPAPVGVDLPRAERLDRETEQEVARLLEDLRGKDYLARVKAEESLKKLMAETESYERARMVRYVVPVLNEPQWGVRAIGLKILMEHGRDCPEAVAELVQVLGDINVNAPMRDAVARTLARWTGSDRGYDAFEIEPRVKLAAREWRKWLEETGGLIPTAREN
ncbi:MAG: hypothetical protein ACYTKD_02135 [Planctomycetota bacterium]|jgi:hypothetical protein